MARQLGSELATAQTRQSRPIRQQVAGKRPASTSSRLASTYLALRRWLLPGMLLLGLLACTWAGYSAYRLYQAWSYNRLLASSQLSSTQRSDSQDAHAMFHDAWRLAQRGLSMQALALYAKVADGKLADGEDAKLAASASYNSGNLYLKQAQQLLDEQGLSAWDSAGPLLSLAKLSYQRALKLKPQWPEAKYNLELALRLAPSIQSSKQKIEDDEEEDMGERPSGWPSIPGFPRGMP